jgi:acyl transferase domain-containing protein
MENAISSNTSVFVNGYNHDHADNINLDPETILKYKPTGTDNSLTSGRVSWFYDFRGPSLTIDTACSGSQVGLHLACQSLKEKESDMVRFPISATLLKDCILTPCPHRASNIGGCEWC